MTLPAEFVTDQKSGRIEVMLGTHLIGVIEAWSDSLEQPKTMGKIEAYHAYPVNTHKR